MKAILLAKPWQVFSVVFGIQFVYRILMLLGNYETLQVYYKYMPIIVGVTAIGFFCWLWYVVLNLQDKIPSDINVKINYFKISFFGVISYLIIVSLYAAFSGEFPKGKIFIGVHLFSFCLIIYCLFFVVKSLKIAEERRSIELSECIGDLVLLFVFPIGIWIIQPRVNKIFLP